MPELIPVVVPVYNKIAEASRAQYDQQYDAARAAACADTVRKLKGR